MLDTLSAVTTNRLLASLDEDVVARLRPRLTRVTLASKEVLHRTGGPIDYVYFPTTCMVSMVATLAEGMQAEVGVVGHEGVVGLACGFGIETSFMESMVQLPGDALRLSVRDFRQEFAGDEAFRTRLLRFNEALSAQLMQTAACNGRHDLPRRLARWLLICHDSVDGDVLPLTQEFIAMMLGVHRPSLTVTAGVLARAGLIRNASGRITVLDRPGLEAASCECYAAVRRRFEAVAEQQPG